MITIIENRTAPESCPIASNKAKAVSEHYH